MNVFPVKNEDGTIEYAPMLQVQADNIVYIFIGTDFHGVEDVKIPEGSMIASARQIGKLNEQAIDIKIQFMMALMAGGWDAEKYPNPEIVKVMIGEVRQYKN